MRGCAQNLHSSLVWDMGGWPFEKAFYAVSSFWILALPFVASRSFISQQFDVRHEWKLTQNKISQTNKQLYQQTETNKQYNELPYGRRYSLCNR
jgi:hypothetical protein